MGFGPLPWQGKNGSLGQKCRRYRYSKHRFRPRSDFLRQREGDPELRSSPSRKKLDAPSVLIDQALDDGLAKSG